jgi:outer membrane cobalamin receptor
MKKIFLALLLLLAAQFVRAQQDGAFIGAGGDDVPGVDLGAVMVENDEENIQTGLNDYGQISTVFKAGALTGGAVTAADLLSDVPGIYYSRASIMAAGEGSFAPSVLNIRGFGNSPNANVLTVVDGRPQSMSMWMHPMLDSLTLDSLESVEIIKGPSGVLYGDQATGGVINITTKKLDNDGSSYTFGVMGGTHYTQDEFFNALYKGDEVDTAITGGYNSTAGDRPNSDSYTEDGHGHAGYKFDDDFSAEINGDYSYIRAFNPGPDYAIYWPREAEAVQSIHRDGDFRLNYKFSDYNGSTMFYTDSGNNRFLGNAFPSTVTPDAFNFAIPGEYDQFENHGIRVANEWIVFPGNSTKAGFDYQYTGTYYENYPYVTSTAKSVGTSEDKYEPYVLLSQAVGIFGISGGLRYSFSSKWGDTAVPQAGFKFSPFDQQTIYFNISKGYSTPAAGQMVFADFNSLNPESFWQYEAGITQTIDDNFTYTLSCYQIEAENMIQVDPMDYTLKNSGFMLERGTEASVDYKLFDFLDTGASASYMDPRDKTARLALFSGKGYIKADINNAFGVKVSADFAKDRYDADNFGMKLGDYAVLNLTTDYKTKISDSDAKFYVNFYNILDTKYYVISGYPAEGFNITCGMTLKI